MRGPGKPGPQAAQEDRMRVKELPEGVFLVQDSQEKRAVVEHIAPAHLVEEILGAYPTLFVEVGNAEYLRVWGCERFVPYLEDQVDLVWGKGRLLW